MRNSAAFVMLVTAGLILAQPPAEKRPTANEPVDCPPEAVKLFTQKVQPVLMNACAACHASGKGGSFTLTRLSPGTPTAAGVTVANLTGAARQVNKADVAGSPLLKRAVTAHGGATLPAIKDVNAPPYKHLENWARLVAGDAKAEPAAQSPAEQPAPGPPPGAKDEFDPDIFNRQLKPAAVGPIP